MEVVSDTAVFVRVVEEGSFTAAARALELSKGAVSKYVSRLESQLGARLLNRTTRRLTLTESGEAYYGRASRALAELGAAAQDVTDQAGSPRGHLRVTAPTFYGAEILSRHLCEFHRHFPNITLELILDNRMIDLVEERIDVAIRMSAPRDSSLVMHKIADIPLAVCAAPAYIERHGRPDDPNDLREHECLIYTLSPRPHEWVFLTRDGHRYAAAVGGSFEVNDDHTLRQLGIDGLGILRMPKLFLADAIANGRLVQLWSDDLSPTVTLAALYPSRAELPGKVRAFVDFLVGMAAGSIAPDVHRVAAG